VTPDTDAADQAVERMRMRLAEAGYPDWPVWWVPNDQSPVGWNLKWLPTDNPAVEWQAGVLAFPASCPCWSCWYKNSGDVGISYRCTMGDCSHLGPPTPPAELLRRGS